MDAGGGMTEQELREKVARYLESTFQDGAVMATRPNSGYYKRVKEFTDSIVALITQYGDTREPEGRKAALEALPLTNVHIVDGKIDRGDNIVVTGKDLGDALAELEEEEDER